MSLKGFELMVLAFNGELRQRIRDPARAHRTGGISARTFGPACASHCDRPSAYQALCVIDLLN
jgi:hypothetical protein